MTRQPPNEEQRRGGRAVVAALFGGVGLIFVVLLWRVFGGG